MNIKRFAYVSKILKFSVLAALIYSTTANAQPYECMLVQSRMLDQSIRMADLKRGNFQVGEVIIDGVNFGSNPKVYLGTPREVAEVLNIGRNNNLDSITLRLPENAVAGTYKLIIQNTTGPFLDNNGEINPIFCFGSVTVGIVIERNDS